MSSLQPDLELDVIVRHVCGDDPYGAQWAVFVGSEKRAALGDQQRAMVFARLLADLQQRPVWLCGESDNDLVAVGHAQLRGCSCC